MRFLIALIASLLFATPAFAQCDTGEAILKLGFAKDAPDSPRRRFAKGFADSASAALQGKACVLSVVSSALYDDDKAVAAVQSGAIQLAMPPFEKLTIIAPKLIVFSLPFAFRDAFALQRFVQTPAYASLLQPLSSAGIAPLGVLHQGFQQLAASKPVHGPEDVRGLRFRRAGAPDLASRPDLLGANARDFADADLAKALPENQIEVLTGSWPFFAANKDAALNGVTETNHRYGGFLFVVSRQLWDSLDEEIRGALIKAASETLAAANTVTLAREKAAMDTLIQSEKPIHAVTDKQREAWLDVLSPMWERVEGDTELLRAIGRANAMP